MSITVKGVKVRSEDLKNSLVVTFNDLTKAAQERLLKKYTDKFFINALLSDYPSIKKIAKSLKDNCSSKTINDAIRTLLMKDNNPYYENYDSDLILELLNAKQLKLSNVLREKFSKTKFWKIRKWVAGNEDTTNDLLNQMLLFEAEQWINYQVNEVFIVIPQNPKFELLDKTKEILQSRFSKMDYYKIMAEIENLQLRQE